MAYTVDEALRYYNESTWEPTSPILKDLITRKEIETIHPSVVWQLKHLDFVWKLCNKTLYEPNKLVFNETVSELLDVSERFNANPDDSSALKDLVQIQMKHHVIVEMQVYRSRALGMKPERWVNLLGKRTFAK